MNKLLQLMMDLGDVSHKMLPKYQSKGQVLPIWARSLPQSRGDMTGMKTPVVQPTMAESVTPQALAAKARRNQPTVKSPTGRQLSEEEIRLKNKQFAQQYGKRYNELTGAVEPLLSANTDRVFRRAEENIVDPMLELEMALAGAGLAGKGLKALGKYAVENTALKSAYKINPWAVKENPEMFLYRARPVGQDVNMNMAAQLKAKEAAGETLTWWQKNLLNKQTNPQMTAREKYYGQWFEKDPSRLDFYIDPSRRNFADNDVIEILRTKLPKSEAAKLNVSKFPDAKTITSSPETEFILPKNMVESSERFPESFWQQLIQQDKEFNTPHWLKGYKEAAKPLEKGNSFYPVQKVGPGRTIQTIREAPFNPEFYTVNEFGERVPKSISMTGYNNVYKGPLRPEEIPKLYSEMTKNEWKNYYRDQRIRTKNNDIDWSLQKYLGPLGYQKEGGLIEDNMGQWNHPGKNTRIRSSNITMEGVPYPVLAKASNGMTKMMQPGQDYYFPGAEYVDEYPMMQQGGSLPSYQFKGQVSSKDSVRNMAGKILKYEQLRGGPGGASLPQYADPKYMDMLMDNIYHEVKKIMPNASAMETGEAMDFIFNAGWDKSTNKIQKDPRAYALQEYYRKNDPSKLDPDGKWSGRKNPAYSFDQEYNATIGKLSENERRILMNKGRDWYYKNINNPSPGVPSSDYNDTWYGRIWNTNDYAPFNAMDPRFIPKKEEGGEKAEYKGFSIVDYLATRGYSGNKTFRKALAEQYDVEGYDFSAKKNLELLAKIRQNDDLLEAGKQDFTPVSVEQIERLSQKNRSNPITNAVKQDIEAEKRQAFDSLRRRMTLELGYDPYLEGPKKPTINSPELSLSPKSPYGKNSLVNGLQGSGRQPQGPVVELPTFQQQTRVAPPARSNGKPLVLPPGKSWQPPGWDPYLQQPAPAQPAVAPVSLVSGPGNFQQFPGYPERNTPAQRPPSLISGPGNFQQFPGYPAQQVSTPVSNDNVVLPDFEQPFQKQAWDWNQVPDPAGFSPFESFPGYPESKVKQLPKKDAAQVAAVNRTTPVNYSMIPDPSAFANEIGKYYNLGTNYAKRQYYKFFGDDDSQVSVLNQPVVNTPKKLPTNKPGQVATPPQELPPAIIKGNNIWDEGNRVYHAPEIIDLTRTKWGHRNRGDRTEVNSAGYEFGVIDDPKNPSRIKSTKSINLDDAATYVGIDKEGKMKVGTGKMFRDKEYFVGRFNSLNNVTGFKRKTSGDYDLIDASDAAADHVSPQVINESGETRSAGLLIKKNSPNNYNLYGNITGGHIIVTSPDYKKQILISGSLTDVDTAMNKFMKDNKLSKVNFVQLDNGSFSRNFKTTDNKITAKDWKKFDERNTSGGSGFFLQGSGMKYGGVSNAEGLPQYQIKGQVTPSYTDNTRVAPKIDKFEIMKTAGKRTVKDQFNEAMQFQKAWMQSPMYKKMIQTSDPKNVDDINERRQKGLLYATAKFDPFQLGNETTGGFAQGTDITLLPNGLKTIGSLAHEVSHAADSWDEGYDGSRAIPNSDINRINFYKTKNLKEHKKKEGKEFDQEWYDYVTEPTETRARLNTIRQAAHLNKLYDPFTQKVTPEIYKKLRDFEFEPIKTGFDPLWQLKGVYSDQQIIDLLNSVSKNNSQAGMDQARYGGGLLSRSVSCSNCGHSWRAVDGGADVMSCHKCGGMVKMQKGGPTNLWKTNKAQWADSVNHANMDKNFVQRYYLKNGPSMQIPGKQGTSTHFMEESDGMVYPTVVQYPGDAFVQYLNASDKNGAYNYAKKTGQFIKFPTVEQAAWYADNGYKTGTGVTIGKKENGGQHGGLDRWFAEKWVDVKTGKDCGRQEGESRKGYPACRPSKRVSSQTPKTSSEMSAAEKAKFKRSKTSSERINYNHKRN